MNRAGACFPNCVWKKSSFFARDCSQESWQKSEYTLCKPLLLKQIHLYTGARKDPPGKQKFDGLSPISLEPLVLQISCIPHWKALISSSLEL